MECPCRRAMESRRVVARYRASIGEHPVWRFNERVFQKARTGAVVCIPFERKRNGGFSRSPHVPHRRQFMATARILASEAAHVGQKALLQGERPSILCAPLHDGTQRIRRICVRSCETRPVSYTTDRADIRPRFALVDLANGRPAVRPQPS